MLLRRARRVLSAPAAPLVGCHFFPTRRSSDLTAGTQTQDCCQTQSPKLRSPARPVSRTPQSWCDPPRSEEHTSELQSRFDLVCRLLLEKKNKYMISVRRKFLGFLTIVLADG